MKRIINLFCLLPLTAFLGLWGKLYAQCGNTGCNDNTFLKVTDPNTMVYDNIVSTFHSSIAKKGDATVWVWGENADAGGLQVEASPTQVTPANGYNYTGNILLFSAGSNGQHTGAGTGAQFTLLTTAGLYAWGNPGAVYDNTVSAVFGNAVKTTSSFGLLVPRGGNTPNNGLPLGVMPNDVKMLFSTVSATAILTCSGNVWVLSKAAAASYGNNTPNASAGFLTQNTWQQVQQSAVSSGDPLNNVVAVRGSSSGSFVALKSNGTLWTWGASTYLGNGTAMASRPYAQQMQNLPATPKMIGMTNQGGYTGFTSGSSYYLLGTNGNVYSLGRNENRQLGDGTTTERTNWVQVTSVSNVAWISPQEHDGSSVPAINVLTTQGRVWAWGDNNGSMLGAAATGPTNPFSPPQGLSANDVIGAVETGGHTSIIIKQCETNFGYVGHHINGSMGDGTTNNAIETSYSFSTAVMPLCSAGTIPEIGTADSASVCNGFTLTANSPGTTNQWSIFSGNATVNATTGVLTLTGPGPIRVLYGSPGCEAPDTVTLMQRDFGNLPPATWPIASATNTTTNSAWLGTAFPTTDCQTTTTDPADGLTITGATGSGTQASPWVLSSGRAYTFNLTVNGNGTPKPVYWAVWYDANNDGDFTDAGDYFNTGNTTHGSPVAAPPFSVTTPLVTTETNGAIRVAASATDSTFTKAMNGAVALRNGEIEDFFVLVEPLPPVAVNDTAVTPMNTPLNGNVTTNDTCNAGPCSYSPLASDPANNGTLTINPNGTYTYTPNAGFTGTDTFSYVLCNSGPPVQCDTAQVVITVTGPPVAVNDTASTPMNTPLSSTLSANDTCRQGPCNYSPLASDPANNGTVTINPNGTYTYTPNAGFTGTDTFSYVLCNSGPPVKCDTAQVVITVTGAPVAVNDTASTQMNTPLSSTLSTNDTCRQGPCNYSPLSSDPPANGTVTLNPDGTYTYTPNTGFTGTDTFSYVLCNSGTPVRCDTAQVVITVTGSPVAVDDTASTSINTPLNSTVATNDTCRQGPCHYSPLSSDPPTNGTVTINPNGTYTYTPNTGFTGTDTFSYVLCNSGTPARCDTAKVVITIQNVLPAELLSFTAKALADCGVQLSWTTGVELNFSRFDIEAGTDGIRFSPVGNVTARGGGSSYSYLYRQGVEGRNYFRLKMVDRDGSYSHSRIESASLDCAPERHIRVYPTVNKGRVTVEGLQAGETVLVYDMKGIPVLQTKAGGPAVQLDLSHTATGSYTVIVIALTGERMHYKIVKE